MKDGERGGECPRRRRGLRNEAMSASVTCVWNPIVAVGIYGDEGLVLFWAAVVVSDHVVCRVVVT